MKIKKYQLAILFLLFFIVMSCSKEVQQKNNKIAMEDTPSSTIGFIVRHFSDKDSLFANEAVDSYSQKNNIETIFTTARTNKTLLKNIDLLKEKGAKGIIISSPDPKLGSAIYSRTNRLGIKVLAIRNKFMNLNGVYMDKVPFLGISTNKTSILIAKKITETIKENNLSINDTGLLFLKEPPNTIFEDCINQSLNLLSKIFPNKNLFNCYAIPAPDGVIVSPAELAKIKAGHFKKWIIFGFDIKKTEKIAKLLATKYSHSTNDIYSFSIIFNRNYMVDNIMPVNYIGSIFIDPKQYGYKSIEIMYNWIKKKQSPKEFTEIKTEYMKNPNYKPLLTLENH